jgi:hypothetical protein
VAHDSDLTADLNGQDDDGLGWSTLADARDRSRVRPGAMLLDGNRYGQAVVRIVAVDDDGQIHVVDLAWLGGQEPSPAGPDCDATPAPPRARK